MGWWGWWGWWGYRRADPLVSPIAIRAATRRPVAVALDKAPSPPHARKGCCSLPKPIGRIHLHSVFGSRFLIREPDFDISRDVMLGPKEERYQTCNWAMNFLAYSVVTWLAAVVEQLQTPGARVPRPRCAVYPQFILEVEFSLVHAMVQHIVFSWPDPFERAKVRCQESATSACWYESG